MSNVNYGTFTAVDLINANAYAQQQINKMKCQDSDIINSICSSQNFKSPGDPGGGTCISWQENPEMRTFPTPQNYYTHQCSKDSDCEMGTCDPKAGICVCTTDKDCKRGMNCLADPENTGNLICGYAPPDVAAGHCVFNNEQACVAQGEVPYKCNDDGCSDIDNKSKLPYTEWHVDDQGKGQCILGNFALRKWCEDPTSRCAKRPDGTYPEECKGSAQEPGITDVPPFYYDKNKSACYMTHDYCNAYGIDYNKGTCTTDSDCDVKSGEKCVQGASAKYCTGPGSDCQRSAGEEAGQFFLGNTLFYMFKKGKFDTKSCGPGKKNSIYEGYTDFNEGPEVACTLADSDFMERKKILTKGFAGEGINLYAIQWKNGNGQVGFDADEVGKIYPETIKIKDGAKYICISREQIKNNSLKRIYLTINSRSWLTGVITNMAKNFIVNNKS